MAAALHWGRDICLLPMCWGPAAVEAEKCPADGQGLQSTVLGPCIHHSGRLQLARDPVVWKGNECLS